jgi:alkylhydroperoxidase family enzyme
MLREVCADEEAAVALAAHTYGSTLDATDRAVVAFADKVARDPASVDVDDVDALRSAGLSDDDIADVVFAVAARCFFATVLDGMGARVDHQIGAAFAPEVMARLTVGRPVAAPDPDAEP